MESTAFDVNPPAVSVAFSTGANGQTLVTINATATIKTYFMAILPEDQTLSRERQLRRPLAANWSCRWCWTVPAP